MLRIMQSRKLQFEKVDTSSRDCSGRTAEEVLQSTRCSESFRLEFMQFLHDLTSLQTVRSSQIEEGNTSEKAEGGFLTRARWGSMTKGLFYTGPFSFSAILISSVLVLSALVLWKMEMYH
jgi:hypothetical protein